MFDASDPTFRADPHAVFRRLRAVQPVQPVPDFGLCWLFRHADCEEALRDPRLGSPLGTPETLLRRLGNGPAAGYIGATMLAQDPPVHTRQRRAVAKAFTAGATERLRPRIESKVDGLLDAATAGGRREFDLANEVAYRLPVSVVCDLLGVPAVYHDRFRTLIEDNAAVIEPMPTPEQVAAADKASGELMTLLGALADERRVNPSDDLLSGLVAGQGDAGALSDHELAANAALLVAAGFSTSMLLLCNIVVSLLRHPDQLAAVRADPEGLAAGAVEETLRYEPPVVAWPRTALEPVFFGGHGVPAGFTVLSVLASANRDEAVFDRPDDFDVTRGPSAQLTFGGAVHHCLGEPLARLEAEIAVRAIVTRFPDLRLAADEVDWLETFTQRGPKALPVAV